MRAQASFEIGRGAYQPAAVCRGMGWRETAYRTLMQEQMRPLFHSGMTFAREGVLFIRAARLLRTVEAVWSEASPIALSGANRLA